MDSYGFNLKNFLKLFEIDKLPEWSLKYSNSILFDKKTEMSYIGHGPSNKWVPLGLSPLSVKSYAIDWDVNLEGDDNKVSAKDIPIKYLTENKDVNYAITDLSNKVGDLKSGSSIENSAIQCHHIDKTSQFKVDSECLLMRNSESRFPNNSTIENAINLTYNKKANQVQFSDGTSFGGQMGFNNLNVENGLVDIEDFLNHLSGSNIEVNCPDCGTTQTKLQYALDYIFTELNNIKSQI
jgi:hypothetical protein